MILDASCFVAILDVADGFFTGQFSPVRPQGCSAVQQVLELAQGNPPGLLPAAVTVGTRLVTGVSLAGGADVLSYRQVGLACAVVALGEDLNFDHWVPPAHEMGVNKKPASWETG